MGGWVWVLGYCFWLARAGFGFARGDAGIRRDGFWECGFGVWGGTGWVRSLMRCEFGLRGLC